MVKLRTFKGREATERNASITSTAPATDEEIKQNEHARKVDTKALTGASHLTIKQSLVPLTLVTILFFLWGFAYGLLDTLNAKFQDALGIGFAQSAGLQAAYFGAPSAVKMSFGGFCGSMFIVGSGLSSLETSANPYIAVCGPPRLSEFRLEMSQSVQAIGTVVAPLLASKVFFNKVDLNTAGGNSDLSNVQWTYLGIACFVFLLAVVFFFAPIPEVTDADMALQADQTHELTDHVQQPLHKQYKLFFGVLAQFCYVGGQVALASIFIKYAQESAKLSLATSSNRYALGQGVFAIGRFAAAGGMLYIKPRIILWVFSTGVIIFTCCAIGVWGEGGVGLATMILFFESCMFPTILTLSIRGLGKHTKRGGSFVVAATSGGAFFPALTGLAADRWNVHVSLWVPLIGFIISFAFAAAVNTKKSWVRQLDGFRKSKIGYKEDGTEVSEGTDGSGADSGSEEEKKGGAVKHVEV
ncbi:MAG: hypothetical protein Q9159_005497 [Coniocarpon cinnabarinum]